MTLINLLQNLFAGISIGSIYALIGLGFVITINGVGILNMAHGEILMLGGFLAVTFTTALDLPLFWGYLLALVCMTVFGYILNLAVLRPMIDKPIFTVMIATIGLGMVLQCFAMNIWGPYAVELKGPFGNKTLDLGGVVIPYQYLLLIAALVVVCVLLWIFYNRTITGKQMRAMSQMPDVAKLLGTNTKRLTAITIMLSCAIAGLTGILMGPIYFVTYAMGSVAIGKGFTAIVLGGFGKVEGAVLGGILLGIIETLLAAYVSPMFKDGFAFLVLVVVLIIRPKGILGEPVSQRV